METGEPADRADILRELGDLDEVTVERILAEGPTVATLVDVRQHLRGTARGRPAPVVARLLDLLRDLRDLHESERRPT